MLGHFLLQGGGYFFLETLSRYTKLVNTFVVYAQIVFFLSGPKEADKFFSSFRS